MAVARMKLRLMWVDPWSVTKAAFLVGVCHAAAMAAATFFLWGVADQSGAIASARRLAADIGGPAASAPLDQLDASHVGQFIAVLAGLDVAVFTCSGMIAAGLFNLATRVVGGWTIQLAPVKPRSSRLQRRPAD